MTRELFSQFFPMGKPLEEEQVLKFMSQPWDNSRGGAYVHIIFVQNKKVWFVLNGPDKKYQRGPDWGLPTEEVLPGERIFLEHSSKVGGAVQRLAIQELNLLNPEDYTIEEAPAWASKDKFGHFHFVFVGSLEIYPGVYTDIPEKPVDVAGEVTCTRLVDIFEDLEEESRDGKTILALEKIPVRIGHVGFLKLVPEVVGL